MSKSFHTPTMIRVVLLTFFFFLVLSFVSGIALKNEHQRHVLFTEELAKGQLEIVASISETELQKGNYASLSGLIKKWAAKSRDIDEIKLVSRNGFIIAGYGPIKHNVRRYMLERTVPYSYLGLAKLTMAVSLEDAHEHTFEQGLKVAVAVLFLTAVFALLTYLFLSRRYEASLLSMMIEELKDTESRNKQLAAYPRENPNPIIAFNSDGEITFKNPALKKLMGKLGIDNPINMLPASHEVFLQRLIDGEHQVLGENEISQMHLLAHYQMIDVTDEVFIYIEDITAQRIAEKALRKERNQARTTLASIGDSVVTVNMGGLITYLNNKAMKLLRVDAEEVIGQPFSRLVRLMDGGEVWDVEKLIEQCRTSKPNQVVKEQVSLLVEDSDALQVQVTATRVSSQASETDGVVIVLRDVTREYRLQEELHRQASHDSLTDLINRSAFEIHLENALETARSRGREHILCFMDLDQFKMVNDTCGHVAGDELLRQLARLMRKHFRGSDVLARVGGDEFSAILIDCPLGQAIERIDSLREDVQQHNFYWENHSFRVGLSIGVSPINMYSESVTQLISAADAACYSAKDSGRNRIIVSEKDSATTKRRLGEMQWLSRINNALDQNHLVLYAQPIVDMKNDDKVIVALEILVRMRSADGDDLIPPGAFLPAAERYDLIERVDHWVVEEVMRVLANCNSNCPDCFINLSGGTLTHDRFIPLVKMLMEKYEIRPEKITFEVTETAAIQNLSSALKMIRELHEFGCHFALDDFGSGLSSFGYLKNLPVDYLKIDGMFIKDMLTDSLDKGMVEAIKTVADTMRLTTIAEFVENDTIIEELRLMGIGLGQGYGIARPRPLEDYISKADDSNVIWL
jgi:Amt family ammonium transporter